MRTVDNCRVKHAIAILDKVDAGELGNFEGTYLYRTDPWFLDIIREALYDLDARYEKREKKKELPPMELEPYIP